jgi:hypothetical protein
VFNAPFTGRGSITYSMRSLKCQVSGAGQMTVKLKCPLQDTVYTFGSEGCNACSRWAVMSWGGSA